jgi:hypothetical protein
MNSDTKQSITWLSAHLGLRFLLVSSRLRNGLQTSFLLLLCLWAVFVQKLEELRGGVLVEGVRELCDGGGDFETLAQDDFLALEADIFGPFDETGQIRFGTDVLACKWIPYISTRRRGEIVYEVNQVARTDTEVLWLRFEKRIFDGLGCLACGVWGGGRLLASSFGLGLVIETRILAIGKTLEKVTVPIAASEL